MNDTNNDRFLDAIDVASPCTASWDEMTGNAQVRHCRDCKLNVYNLSEMARETATALVRETEGSVCVRFYRRLDGTVITKDCPVGFAAVRRRARLAYARVVALLGLMFAGLTSCTDRRKGGDNGVEPNRSSHGALQGKPMMGDLCVPEVPAPRQLMGEVCLPESVSDPEGTEKRGTETGGPTTGSPTIGGPEIGGTDNRGEKK